MQENPEFEEATRKLVAALRQPVQHDTAKILHLPRELALWVADMIDIGGVRPHWVAMKMREALEEFDAVRLLMPPKVALEVAGLMDSGLMRHQAGAPDPSSFRLH